MNDHMQQFRQALAGRNIIPPTEILDDGRLHRCDAEGKGGKGDAAYLLHSDGIPAGGFENHRDGLGWQSWRADIGRNLTPTEEAAHRAKIEAARRAREAEEAERKAKAREKACMLWAEAYPCNGHPYLTKKGINANGAKVHRDRLVLPMRDAKEQKIHSLQFIGADGEKRYLTGGRKEACYFGIGKPEGVLCIAEGFATGASIHEATGYAVAVAFDCGNLFPVAKALRERFPDIRLVLCADDDYQTPGNPGLTKAWEAALAVGGAVAVPVFDKDRPDNAKDFNDMAALCGKDAVKRAIENATAPTGGEHQPGDDDAPAGDSDGNGWPDPHPLAAKIEPEAYPLDALPNTIRAAVEEVAGFVKAPAALVASSALAALSLACQAHIDAKRAEKLHGPVGLFLLTIADSGERKSTCDGFFTSAIRQYQEEQAEAMKPAIKEYQATLAAWEAERDGILSAVKDAGKKGKPTDKLRGDLAQLQQEKPEPPRVPRLILGDETPENLAWSIAKQWPSAGVLSSEAGVVFGSHGMGKDSAMRNLALLNVLWDGGAHSIGRRTSESFTVRGARLTMGLMIQETTLREYFSKSGGLARGTGFLARFLVAWPESTQGQRLFTEAPANWPHLAAFHRRIAAILNQPAPIGDDGALTPAMLSLAPDAKAAWVGYHDAIESELASGGELYDVRDVASKSADNAARLAALFQQFEHGMGGAVGLDSFERASRITAWHLSEARRFFGELALPAELADAARLDSWLIEHCRQERTNFVKKNYVRQHGPLRDGARLDAAIRELAELDRLQLEKDGKRLTIHLNPALVGVTT
jgi:putative DNA primase/helicase